MVRYRSHAKRRDENEKPIFDALKRIGRPVERLDPPLPDLLTETTRGRLLFLEVKHDGKPQNGRDYKTGGLTDRQVAFHLKWGAHIVIVRTVDEAIRAVAGS